MKKQIIFTALTLGAIILGTNSAKAQTGTTTDPIETEVNIILNDVISIDAGSVAAGGAVDFNYVTSEDYNNDKSTTVANSLKVTSTQNFNVNVKAKGKNFENGSLLIPVDVLRIQGTTTGSMGGKEKPEITLSDEDQVLVRDADLGSALTLDIKYTIPAAEASSSKILGKKAGTYTQKVIYTATAL